ncbi:MAG: hypothetical protein EHM73_01755 [Chroococcales cyanobacterium metabat2.561]|uniref:Uncharacterized protein n=1 Tax=Microcystis aeruginosa Ma_SC_T_19800800_S464 TaxID=2486257 RepID=A0A552E4R1_MICAE|nr:MAG: hypothetical protein EHM73_01755 [Chroococcales cyanobacterium metabat2.561]TRU29500.1 MAG: hypothetical protein EWV81_02335 [Microcystis aeruginosa Ma_SC_T_19800800_S464]
MGFLKGKSLLKSGFISDFITQSGPLRVSTPQTPLVRTGLRVQVAQFQMSLEEVPLPNAGKH